MRTFPRSILTAVIFTLCATVNATARGGDEKQLVIFSAIPDRSNETLTIRGVNLGDRAAFVYFEDQPMTILSATDQEVVVHLPAALPDGTYLVTVTRGKSTLARGAFSVALMTTRSGLAGPAGPAGPPGAPGAAGPQGSAGSTGAAGPAGTQGPAGSVGSPGPAGPQGPAGVVGAAGPAGPQGPAGAVGAAGPVGPSGATGAAGPVGPAGATGATGSAGPVGPAGPMGSMGPMGLSGPAGPQGPAGVSGYEVVSALSPVVPVGQFALYTATASCPAGKHAIAGGYEAFGGGRLMVPYASLPSTLQTWRVSLRNPDVTDQANVSVRVYVICASD
ncbi:MAG: IPT/TIG domain-containing protein [Vicinamibacterales bacterium]